MRRAAALALCLAATASVASGRAEPFHLIPGQVTPNKGPDGNTIILDAPKGLIVVDTGRHPEHALAILDYARKRGRPIAAIVNTHWHLDHTTGNWDIRQVYPNAEVYASTAIEGALAGFLNQGRQQGDKMLADPKVPAAQKAELLRGRSRVDNPDSLRPTRPVVRSMTMVIAGRRLQVHLAHFAATEGDVWLYDPKTRVAVVGDLVVDIVPFMDTACPDGWRNALGQIERIPFTTLVPGHGRVMTRSDFLGWKAAYDRFVDCGHSNAPKAQCVDGWMKDDAKFIDEGHRGYVREAADYYLTTRLRSQADEQQRYCQPLKSKA